MTDATTAGQQPTSSGAWRPPTNSVLSIALATTLALAGTLSVLKVWQLPPFTSVIVVTENAYVRGQTTIISPQVSGYIKTISASDYQKVRAGDELLRVDDRVYRQKVEEAQANLDLAQANLANNQQTIAERNFDVTTAEARVASADAQKAKADDDLRRVTQLLQRGTVSTSELDATRATQLSMAAALREAQAVLDGSRQGVRSAQVNDNALRSQVESVRAQLEMAKIDLGYTVVISPEDGELSDVGARRGQYVTSGSQLMFLVPSTRWVVANFKEAQTRNIKVGQHAWFYVDALGAQKFDGVVEQIAPAAGSEFSILRTDNAIGNFVKIPQRISVKIQVRADEQEMLRLRPGMSVEASVDTSGSSKTPTN
ncbi:HlyD family secretion protein [Rhizobium mesoamericanum]|uniref:HlyD family secretion protein n=1 Tax=Rhizobium mesoamericanum TaxID=1079800 RepID=UPI0003F9EB19|nr:HlyD family secretion protein [Rhizobium mesoamericanum]